MAITNRINWINDYAQTHGKNFIIESNIKKQLKNLIDENPEIFNEILTEMRAEKIEKIRNRK